MASGGAKAFELFPQMPFDVIIADLAMPSGNGLAFLKALKDQNLQIPVIFTSPDRSLDPASVLKAGAAGLLCKPVSLREVIENIRKIGGLPDTFSYFLNVRRTLIIASWIGELRPKDREAIKQCAYEVVKTAPKFVILNLHGLSGYDAILAGDIVEFQERIRKAAGWLILCGLERPLCEKMASNGLVNESNILPTLKDALQYMLEIGNP